MKKVLLICILLITSIYATDIKPEKEIEMSGNVMDIKIVNNLLYAGTDNGTMEVYDIENDKIIDKITIKKIHDFMGDLMPPKIYSVDEINGKRLLLAEGEHGSRELYINENNQTTKVITPEDKLTMNKAKFIDDKTVFLGLLSNEIILYDLKNKKQLYRKQLSQSKFSDFALNEDKTKAVISCESGINYLVDVKSGNLIKELKGGNKDNVFKVSFRNGKISAAGQDRVCAVYDEKSGAVQTFNAPFLVYATGLSPDATYAAFAYGEDNEIVLFNLLTNSKAYMLKGQKSTLNTIVFSDNSTLFSGSDDKYIMKWSIK
jgi:WD40 repeat protein